MTVAEALRCCWIAGALVLAPGSRAMAQEATLVDRVVAEVDGDPILESDLAQVAGLGLVPRPEGEPEAAYRRRVLDALIEQTLRFHEIDRFGLTDVPYEEIERQVELLRQRYPDAEAFRRRLEELALDEQKLRQLVARQLMILVFVEERLGPRVFVELPEIRAYYESTLGPELRRRGEPVPRFEQVRESIRTVLKEQRLNEEIERWTAELRARADIVDHLDRPPRELPPRVE